MKMPIYLSAPLLTLNYITSHQKSQPLFFRCQTTPVVYIPTVGMLICTTPVVYILTVGMLICTTPVVYISTVGLLTQNVSRETLY